MRWSKTAPGVNGVLRRLARHLEVIASYFGNFSTAVFEGVWPGATTFVTVGATDSSINLITAGVNSNGTASWTRG